MRTQLVPLAEAQRLDLADSFRKVAEQYDRQADSYRRAGDPLAAAELEQVATDYRTDADSLDLCRS